MEFHELSLKQLRTKVMSLKESISQGAFDIKSGELAKVRDYREDKKDLARAMTILKEKELGIERKIKKIVTKKVVDRKPVKTKKVKDVKETKEKTKEKSKKVKKVIKK
ncbi:MAG: 50S ribosomal protein L29 [candidate division WS6 bacterium GW2011_GWA2_37_6]|uniref:Large ribosomal subunit protein uL29 n=1 Tax=candidate division WS6 bacterium GW2011_GWA2_37_6 TaxID=1619087 RepID=A0A0G0JGL9_9BACT|nr:MAG: 50S ribosomal protein L29 [candidate division WS6 bacterium GW2011_GWA2_37_6]